ncbi:MAG: hypothetical protein AB7S69_12230 [Salinivirgaceae bacterium]
MNIVISKDIFEKNIDLGIMDRIWNIIEDRHQLFLNSDEDINCLMNSEWHKNLRGTSQDIIYDSIVKSLQTKQTDAHVIISNKKGDNIFLPDEALKLLNQPFTIILENNYYDAYFVNSLLRCFKGKSKKILLHKNENWLAYDNGGGCANIQNFIKGKMTAFENLPKPKYKYLRTFVLLDSDKKYPNNIIEERENLIKFLNENNINYHILEKREMENYIPDEVLATIENNDEYIQAISRLSPLQKDYFDIEKGFEKDFKKLEDGVKELYDDLSENDIRIFRNNRMMIGNFKTEFPKLFNHSEVTQASLLKRVEHQENSCELQEILDKITKLL